MESQKLNDDEEFLCGVIERITYHSEESGYTIARIKLPRTAKLTTIVGNFAHIQPGQTLNLQGNWNEHPNNFAIRPRFTAQKSFF